MLCMCGTQLMAVSSIRETSAADRRCFFCSCLVLLSGRFAAGAALCPQRGREGVGYADLKN